MDETRFGLLLRRLRDNAGLSQEELAERAGLSAQAIGALERGDRRAPRRDTVERLAGALALGGADRAALVAAAQTRRRARPVETRLLPPVAAPDDGLIGRAVAFDEVVALIRHAGARLLTIVGPGGVGKTRLGIAVARALAADVAEGMAVVSLAELQEPRQVAAQIGGTLGLSGRDVDPGAALRALLRDRATLLLLDNFEHLLPAAPFIGGLLAECPRLVLLVTSRAPLRLPQERIYELAPLACPEPARTVAPEALADYGATALFAARAAETRPGFRVTATNAPIIAAICARLDGLPLAIELAVARLNVLTPAELLARLTERLPLLTRGAVDLPERQRTLRAAIAWSYDLLNAGEKALFRRLAIFVGGATGDAVAAVCAPAELRADDLGRWLGGLVEQRLVRRELSGNADAARFTMLETVREYAAARLAAQGEEETYRGRHAAHFCALAEKAASHLTGAAQGEWLARLAADHDNLRAALRWAIDSGDAASAVRLGAALWRFWYRSGFWTEGRVWLRAIVELTAMQRAVHEAALLTKERARVHRGAGGLALLQSDFVAAQGHMQTALELARQAGDVSEAASILDNLAVLAKEQGDFRAALALHEDALVAQRALGRPREIAATLNNLGGDHESLSDYRQAVACFAEALTLSRSVGDFHIELISMVNLGGAAQHLGDYARARALGEEALARARQLESTRYAAIALLNLGSVALDRGEAPMAVERFREALGLFVTLGSGTRLALAHGHLGEALRLAGDLAGAKAALADGLAHASTIADDWTATHLILYQGALAEELGETVAALAHYRAALAHARRIEYGWGIVACLNRLGALTADEAEVAASFRESLGRCAAMGTPRPGASALEGMAAVLLAEGEASRAAALLAAADAARARLGTPREPALARFRERILADARAALGDAAFAAASREGHALDLPAAYALAGVVA
jgi:predicted ATPase/transcriptional regulator with XRE-family HTH domain